MRFLAVVILTFVPSWALAYTDMSFIENYEQARAYVAKHRSTTMKDGFSLQLTPCDTDECAFDQAQALVAMKGAYKKDSGDQRNLAFCLSTGCDGAIVMNASLGCAWHIVILASGSAELTDSDVSNFKVECGKIPPAQLATAKAQAAALFRTVYKREISRDFQ